MLAALTGIALFSLMDATMKAASLVAGAYSALLFRALIGTALLLPIWRLGGGRWPRAAVLRIHATRALVVSLMALLFFLALVRLPLAEAIAVSFIAPLFALYLAAVILGERIAVRAVLGSLLGLCGVAVISAGNLLASGLGGDGQATGIAMMVGSALLYGWNLILQRQQALLADPREIAFFQNLLVGALFLLAAPWCAGWPRPGAMALIAAAAVLAAVSLMLFSWAYARAEAQVLLPFEYTAFVWAALFGWRFFAEPVSAATLAGAVLIVAGCLVAARGAGGAHTEQTLL